MPKGSYKNVQTAQKNVKLVIDKTKCDAIKLESNGKNFSIIKNLVKKYSNNGTYRVYASV